MTSWLVHQLQSEIQLRSPHYCTSQDSEQILRTDGVPLESQSILDALNSQHYGWVSVLLRVSI